VILVTIDRDGRSSHCATAINAYFALGTLPPRAVRHRHIGSEPFIEPEANSVQFVWCHRRRCRLHSLTLVRSGMKSFEQCVGTGQTVRVVTCEAIKRITPAITVPSYRSSRRRQTRTTDPMPGRSKGKWNVRRSES
jgi:hypothetical protein